MLQEKVYRVWKFLGSNLSCTLYKLNDCKHSLTVLNLSFPIYKMESLLHDMKLSI